MFCENCGTRLDNGARFCHSCGAPVNQEAVSSPVQSANPQPVYRQPATPAYASSPQTTAPKKSFPIGIVLIGLLLVVLVGYGIFAFGKSDSIKDATLDAAQTETSGETVPELSLSEVIAKRQEEAAAGQAASEPNPEYAKAFEKLGYTDIDEDFGGLPTMSFIELREGDDTTIYETEIAYNGEYVVEIAHLTYRKNHFETMNEMITWLAKSYDQDSYLFSRDYYVLINRFTDLDTEDGMRAYLFLDENEEVSPMVWYYLRDAYLESGYIMK